MSFNKELFINIPAIRKKCWVDILYEKGRGYWCSTWISGYRREVYVETEEIIRERNADSTSRWILSKVLKDMHSHLRMVRSELGFHDRQYLMDEYKQLKYYANLIKDKMNEVS